nr:protein trichome birefringence-like 19 [Ipomoea batatas]
MGPLEIPFDSFTLWTVSHRKAAGGDVSDRSSTAVLIFNGTEREKMRRSGGEEHGRDSGKREVAICPSRFNSAPLSPLCLSENRRDRSEQEPEPQRIRTAASVSRCDSFTGEWVPNPEAVESRWVRAAENWPVVSSVIRRGRKY